jgi:hypothetical protein
MINGGTTAGEQINTSMFSTGIYANASTNVITSGGLLSNGNITLYTASGGDSPAIIWQRSELHQDYNFDWRAYDSGGHLYFDISKSKDGWQNVIRLGSDLNLYINGYTAYHTGNLPAYPTISSLGLDNRYLKLDNTEEAELKFTVGDPSKMLTITRVSGGSYSMIKYKQGSTVYGYLGFTSANTPAFLHSNGSTAYTLYHTGNLPAYPTKSSWNYDDVYLKLIGGTM